VAATVPILVQQGPVKGIMGRLSRKFHLTLREASAALTRRAAGVDLVSIDLFDTLRLRLVPPSAVERRAAEHLVKELNTDDREGQPSVDEVVAHRQRFIRRRERHRRTAEVEWLLRDWLNALADDCSLNPRVLCECGRRAELDAELELTTLAPEAAKLVETARAVAKTLVLTSDTSHDYGSIRTLLGDLAPYFDALYGSGELGLSKRYGGIFAHVAATHSVDHRRCLHIGDHWKADYFRPLQARWQAIWARRTDRKVSLASPRLRRVSAPSRTQMNVIEHALAAPRCPVSMSPVFRLAYETLAPLACLFSLFRWRHFQRHRVETVFYIARDAEIFLQAARLLRPVLPESETWHYVHLSRRATSLAHTGDLLQSLEGLPGKMGKGNVGEFLRQFALPSSLVDELLAEASLGLADSWSPRARDNLARALTAHTPEIVALQHAQREMIGLYLTQQAEGHLGVVGIVDIGWAGTHQDILAASPFAAESIVGCYLGVSDDGDASSARSLKYGLVRDDFRGHPHGNAVDRMAGSIRLLEIAFQEPVGTVARLAQADDHTIVPILVEGSPSTATLGAYQEISEGIRRGVLARRQGVAGLARVAAEWPDEVLQAAASALSRRLTARPTRAAATALLDVEFSEGIVSGSIGAASLRRGIAWYPGLLAKYRLRGLQPLLEAAAELALALGRR
jgi:HAD superfamily hydrolase (TIGR01549 family)